MEDELEQQYVFLRFATADLEQALQSLAMIRRYRRQDIISVLIRDAVVAYGRPFFNNYGPIAKKKNLRLPDSYVPQALWSVHQRSISLRKQAFAHTDLEPLDPRLSRFGSKPNHFYPIRLTPVHFAELQALAKAMPPLIRQVHERVVKEIQRLERCELHQK
jgi:hypothetical protein